MTCSSCGAAVTDGARFCGSCGAKTEEAPSFAPTPAPSFAPTPAPSFSSPGMPSDASWQSVQGQVSHVTLRMTVTCDHCAGRVPINGPTTSPVCPHCQGTSTLRRLSAELCYAAEGSMLMGSPYKYRTKDEPVPQCNACGADVPVKAYLDKVGATTTIPCPSCGAGLATFPAPAWMRKDLPDALQVFGADPEVAKEQAQLELQVDREAAKPVVMACPSCQGGLTITEQTARTTACTYCQSSVFLPDDLWKLLHPVKVQRSWTLTYRGAKLMTAKDKARAEGRTHKDQQKAQQRSVKDAAREAKRAQQRAKAKAKAKRGKVVGALGSGIGISVAIGVVAFMTLGKGCSHAEGTFEAKGKPLGDFVMKPDRCKSLQRQAAFGVLMYNAKKKSRGGAVKLVKDAIKGWVVQVQLPGSCKGGQCRAVTFDREECSRYDVSVRRTNTTVNRIRVLEGHLGLTCKFKGPKGGGTASAQVKFKCD